MKKAQNDRESIMGIGFKIKMTPTQIIKKGQTEPEQARENKSRMVKKRSIKPDSNSQSLN